MITRILQLALACFCLLATRAPADFTSIYAFGDGVSTTTDSPAPSNLYSGGRYCDGPVWIEILCGLQGVTYSAAKNVSYFEHYSGPLVTSTQNFDAPEEDEPTSLFIIWNANADFVKFVNEEIPTNDPPQWQAAITQTINNHITAVNTLYDKGARTIIMPNAVDLMRVPAFNEATINKAFITARVEDFNDDFETAMATLESSKPGLKIIRPDVFGFLNMVLDNFTAYGMENPIPDNAAIINLADPWEDGRHFVFWDDLHPTSKFQNELALFVNTQIPVPDTTPPALTLPDDLVVSATGSQGATVNFTVSADDDVDGPLPADSDPASGSVFPIGTTIVNVSASDAAGNFAESSFKVTVVDMARLLQNVSITRSGDQFYISGQVQGGPPSGTTFLQASSDLGVGDPWENIAAIPLDENGNQVFGPVEDTGGTGLPRNFYRLGLLLSE